MKKTEYTDNPSRDLRRKVADGKGFFNICMSTMKKESEAARKKIRKKFLTKRAGPDIINTLPRERDAQDLEN